MLTITLAVFASLAAVGGGLLALGEKRKLGLMLGFTAGALLGLVAFDLLPEIFDITKSGVVDVIWPMIALVTGFLLFHTLEKFILIHHSHENDYVVHQHPHVGIASSAALVAHSFLDGTAIGVAFQVSSSVGWAVSVAVIGHRFADGFNSVSLMLFHKNKRTTALKVLAVVAIAPIIGALSTYLFTIPESAIAIYLGFFAGFLLYIGASDVLPQAHSKKSTRSSVLAPILGAAFMFFITRLA